MKYSIIHDQIVPINARTYFNCFTGFFALFLLLKKHSGGQPKTFQCQETMSILINIGTVCWAALKSKSIHKKVVEMEMLVKFDIQWGWHDQAASLHPIKFQFLKSQCWFWMLCTLFEDPVCLTKPVVVTIIEYVTEHSFCWLLFRRW